MPRIPLQPIPRFAFLALGLHVLLGAGLWGWLHQVRDSPPSGQSLTWISPADFVPSKSMAPSAVQVTKPEVSKPEIDAKSMLAVVGAPKPPPPPEPVARAIAIDPAKAQALMKPPGTATHEPPPPMDVSRFITVSKRETAAADAGPGALVDKGVRLDEVDRAIIDAFRRTWRPPSTNTLPIDQRTAHMDVTVDRSGHLLNFKLAKRSGNDDFDFSVIEAASSLDKIDAQLPPSYPGDHYEFQVHFHVE